MENFKKLLEDNNKIRDEQLDQRLRKMLMDISLIINKTIEKRIDHLKPSKETLKRLELFEKNCSLDNQEYNRKIEDLAKALEINTRMTTEMYEVWKSANWAGKSFIKLFATIGIITGGIIGLIELLKKR